MYSACQSKSLIIIEYLELEVTHKDCRVQTLPAHRDTLKLNYTSKSIVQVLLEYQHAWGRRCFLAGGSLFYCLTSVSVKSIFLIPNLNVPGHTFQPLFATYQQTPERRGQGRPLCSPS